LNRDDTGITTGQEYGRRFRRHALRRLSAACDRCEPVAGGLKRNGFQSTIEYFNLEFAEIIGPEAYELLSNSLPPSCLVGEWFFADLVFGDGIPDAEDYLTKILRPFLPSLSARAQLLEARQHRAEFIDSCVDRLMKLKPRLVGFPSSFHQTCACLAVAKGLKSNANPPVVIFGGANCEGEMGWQLVRSFPWIDYVATGEADISFPSFIANLLDRGDDTGVPGILSRDQALSSPQHAEDLDALPVPDYSDFFDRARRSSLGSALDPVALIETSRGCWWGAKHHCTFCGLNGETMAFRSKSPQRAFREFASLATEYKVKRIDCVDNILDTRYIQTLLPLLAGSALDLSIFYEVKANLRYDQLVQLKAAGVIGIQPGIESLSDRVLGLMNKGCTGFQNIQLLRWCLELGITVVWNILAGFPGESETDYERQAQLVPLLTHLSPPSCCTPVRLDRFSPFYTSQADFGFERVRPAAAYYYVFPLERRELARLAYYFDFDYADGRDRNLYLMHLREEVGKWWSAQAESSPVKPRLDAKPHDRGVLIEDTREIALKPRQQLSGIPAQLYLLCDTAKNLGALTRAIRPEIREPEVREILEGFVSSKIMARLGDQYLSLAVFNGRNLLMKEGIQSSDIAKVQPPSASHPLLRVV